YIGFRGLDWATMALSFEFDLKVHYRPFRLDADTPSGGKDRAATLARKFPDPEVRAQMEKALKEAMLDVGLEFDLRTPTLIPDTTDAHRLLRWAHEEEVPHDMAAALFEAYWQHGEDLSQHDVLCMVAERAGLDKTAIVKRLNSHEDVKDVQEEAADFRAGGVAGVPAYIVNEQTGFEGALPKAQLLEALRKLAAE
ncbi:MAG: DsbA family oxidoreductase, partial [Pseudomonadota bacterium]